MLPETKCPIHKLAVCWDKMFWCGLWLFVCNLWNVVVLFNKSPTWHRLSWVDSLRTNGQRLIIRAGHTHFVFPVMEAKVYRPKVRSFFWWHLSTQIFSCGDIWDRSVFGCSEQSPVTLFSTLANCNQLMKTLFSSMLSTWLDLQFICKKIFAQIIGNKPSETCSLTGILQGIAFICLLRNQKQCTSLPGSYRVFLNVVVKWGPHWLGGGDMRGSKEEKGGNIKRVSCCFSSPALSSDTTSPWTEKEGKHSTGFSASRGWYQTKHARCSFCPLEALIWKCTVCSWQE